MGISREGAAHRWLRGTRLLFVCGLLAAPFGCDEAGCSKAQTSELRFFGRGGQVLAIKDTLNQATFSASQLGGLPSVPLTDLGSVDISGDYSLAPVDNQGLFGRQVEAHLFVADLAAMNEELRFVGAAQPVSEWDALTGPRHMGGTAVLPFPPNPDWNTSIRYNPGPIFGGYFWPGVGAR